MPEKDGEYYANARPTECAIRTNATHIVVDWMRCLHQETIYDVTDLQTEKDRRSFYNGIKY